MSRPRVYAYYLPQFHKVAENDEWWGDGFTEWTNVQPARPLFRNHHQPRVPAKSVGYYDLMEDAGVLPKQAALAKAHGIEGFCFYYYHFAPGKRLLEKPVDQMLETGAPDFPFCLQWANETWSRRWNGENEEPLIKQETGPEVLEAVAHDVARHFNDPRHTRVDGRPVFLIYRPSNFQDPLEATRLLRKIWREQYSTEVYLCGGLTRQETNPLQLGYDAAFEFPPHKVPTSCLMRPEELEVEQGFAGNVFSYMAMVEHELQKELPSFPSHPCAMLAWDNTARMRNRATVFHEYFHYAFYLWLRYAVKRTQALFAPQESLVFVNAWNEWAEGTCLEPDERSGLAPLKVVQAVVEDVPWAEFVSSLEDPELRACLLKDMDGAFKRLFQRQLDLMERPSVDVALIQAELEKARQRTHKLNGRIEKLQKRRTALEDRLTRASTDLTKARKSVIGRMVAPLVKLEHKIRRR